MNLSEAIEFFEFENMKENRSNIQDKRVELKLMRSPGGLFLGGKLMYPITASNNVSWKLRDGKFVRHPWQYYSVWSIQIGIFTHVLAIYFRKPQSKLK